MYIRESDPIDANTVEMNSVLTILLHLRKKRNRYDSRWREIKLRHIRTDLHGKTRNIKNNKDEIRKELSAVQEQAVV